MLDPQVLRNDIEQVAKTLAKRGYTLDVSTIKKLEEKRKAIQVKTQELQQGKRRQDREPHNEAYQTKQPKCNGTPRGPDPLDPAPSSRPIHFGVDGNGVDDVRGLRISVSGIRIR